MTTASAKLLKDIFQMVSPATAMCASQIKTGTPDARSAVLEGFLDILYGGGSIGAVSTKTLVKNINNFFTKPDSASQSDDFLLIGDIFRMFSTQQNIKILEGTPGQAAKIPGESESQSVSIPEIVGSQNVIEGKDMALVLCTSPFLTPAMRNSSRVEMFMNFLPPLVASRLQPYLDIEFEFKRASVSDSAVLSEPGMLKFLLGSGLEQVQKSDKLMRTARSMSAGKSKRTNEEITAVTAGMEMFTSPQMLVNLSPEAQQHRYANVLDPFRPMMTIEGFNISATPSVGLFSYKKATLTLRLHDRSRLAEISDIIRPQIYQNVDTAPTIWVTYGWLHPEDSSVDASVETYADFINNNMLVREAYGLINSQFAFDQTGQVTLTLELWTKGVAELRTKLISKEDDNLKGIVDDIANLAENIANIRDKLSIGRGEGVNAEIRGVMLLDSAERGTFPADQKVAEVKAQIEKLHKDLVTSKNKDGKSLHFVNDDEKKDLNTLKEDLLKLYVGEGRTASFKEQLATAATTIVNKKFAEAMEGFDPFLPEEKSDGVKVPHPFSSFGAALNAANGEGEIKDLKIAFPGKKSKIKNKFVSFGKLTSVFLAGALKTSSIDDLQIFFYQMNANAGLAASTNIAEFLIDMPVFLDQYREYIERKGSEQLTIEEFMSLVINYQIGDMRAVCYGLRSFFKPYDKKNMSESSLLENKDVQEGYEKALSGFTDKNGFFRKPSIEVYIETMYADEAIEESQAGNKGIPIYRQIELRQQDSSSTSLLRKVTRMHIFDKANNPFTMQALLLKGGGTTEPVPTILKDWAKEHGVDLKEDFWDAYSKGKIDGKGDSPFDDVLKALVGNFKSSGGKITTYDDIKKIISHTMPSIIFGCNGSAVMSANLASKQDPLMATAQFQSLARKTGKAQVGQPDGSGVLGLPLRIIPASMTMSTLGCPLLNIGQFFFVDFNTGTTADNIYALTGVTHTFSPGRFESSLTLTFADSYAKYEGSAGVKKLINEIEKIGKSADT